MYEHLKADYGQCKSLPYTNDTPAEQHSGAMVVSNGKLGMLYETVAPGEETALVVDVPEPGIEIPKADGVAFGQGDPVAWDTADGAANDDAANNTVIGYAYLSAAAGDARVRVVLQNVNGVS